MGSTRRRGVLDGRGPVRPDEDEHLLDKQHYGVGYDLGEREAESLEEVEGGKRQPLTEAWRRLCQEMLVRAVRLAATDPDRERAESSTEREVVRQHEEAVRWIKTGNRGLVTFAECCEALDLDSEVARRRVWEYVQAARQQAGLMPHNSAGS